MTAQDWLDVARSGSDHAILLRLGNREFIAGFELDSEAVGQRLEVGAGAITDYAASFALWQLPLFGRVEVDRLPTEHIIAIRALPPGLVEFRGTTVERRVRPPITAKVLIAIRAQARTALDAFGDRWWAPSEVAVSHQGTSENIAADARRLGIGLHSADQWIVQPAIKTIGCPTPLLWWQAELIFDRWLTQPDRATA